MVKANELLGVEKLDEETRKILQKTLRHLRKIRNEERAAEEIVEEVKQRRQQTEDDMWLGLDEYIALGDSEKTRPRCMNQYIGGERGERLQ